MHKEVNQAKCQPKQKQARHMKKFSALWAEFLTDANELRLWCLSQSFAVYQTSEMCTGLEKINPPFPLCPQFEKINPLPPPPPAPAPNLILQAGRR